jgi:hypothetical protein
MSTRRSANNARTVYAGAVDGARTRHDRREKISTISRLLIGEDFNTNQDQAMFASEKTLNSLKNDGFQNPFEGLPLSQRVTHPANHGYPDATFDYLFGKNFKIGKAFATPTDVSDHWPVTCDFELE